MTGLEILTLQFFPFALPLVALVIAPLALPALPALLVAGIFVLPLWLGRVVRRSLSRRRRGALTRRVPEVGRLFRAESA
jgi:membrane protein implicated in regulation of membrane protease activity